MFDTTWDINKYKGNHEPEEHWALRKQFMAAHKKKFPEERLVCLTQVFFNMEFLGCKYPEETMDLVNQLSAEVADDFRESRKGRLKRTFVGAQDAAGAKAKRSKPPTGQTEQAPTNVKRESSEPPWKRPRIEQDDNNYIPLGSERNSEKKQSTDSGCFSEKNNYFNSDQSNSSKRNREEQKNIIKTEPGTEDDYTEDSERDSGEPEESGESGWKKLKGGQKQKDTERPSVKEPLSAERIATLKKIAETFVFMIPPRSNSRTEQDCMCIMRHNFSHTGVRFSCDGTKANGWNCQAKVIHNITRPNTPPTQVVGTAFAMTQKEAKNLAAIEAVDNLKKFCTYLEPNPEWFKEGRTPDFIEKRIPCNKNPRSYLIMTKKDTGHITPESADMLMQNFIRSSNEDMFFLHGEYNIKEKEFLMGRSQVHKLGFRHFGEGVQLKDHSVCIYKIKSAKEIMEDARKNGWKHPKYLINFKNSDKNYPR